MADETTDTTETTDTATDNNATVYDDLRKEYATHVETSAAAVAQLQAEKAEVEAKLQAVMAHNYELLSSVSNTPDPAPDEDESSDGEVDIDPLFE